MLSQSVPVVQIAVVQDWARAGLGQGFAVIAGCWASETECCSALLRRVSLAKVNGFLAQVKSQECAAQEASPGAAAGFGECSNQREAAVTSSVQFGARLAAFS